MNKRIFLDALMLVLFLATMCFHHLPKLLHEVMGLVFPATVILHLLWNFKWFSSLRRGRYDVLRLFSVVVDWLLIASLVMVVITGILISNYLFKGFIPLELARNITAHQLHVSLSFWLLILIGLHLGLHWEALWSRFKSALKFSGSSALVHRCSLLLTALVFVAGIYGSYQNELGARLMMKHIFATPALSLHGVLYALLLLAVVALYAVLAHALKKAKGNIL